MLFSVIIAAKNEEKNIGRCLQSLLRQNFSPDEMEIVVVDNDSSDNTREIARKFTGLVFNLAEERESFAVKNFRGAQINLGASLSTGDILFFPDTDMTFHPELLGEVAEKIKGRDALFIPEIVSGKGFLGKVRNFERSFYDGTCIDAARIVRKKVFLSVGGFEEKDFSFGPDDWDFNKKIKREGARLGVTKNPLYHHEEALELRSYLKKKRNYVPAFKEYVDKWGGNDPDVKKQFSFFYRFFGVFWENGKWKKLAAHPVLALGMYFLRFLVGVVFLLEKIYGRSEV